MKKVFLAAAGVALLMLLLAVAGGVALASSQTSTPSTFLQEQPAIEPPATESPVNVVETQSEVKEDGQAAEQVIEEIEMDAEGDDDPESEHAEGGCTGHAEGSMWPAKVDAAAKFLGLTPEEIAAQVEAGKRLYKIAEGQGADVEAFREAMHTAVAAAGGCGCGSH